MILPVAVQASLGTAGYSTSVMGLKPRFGLDSDFTLSFNFDDFFSSFFFDMLFKRSGVICT